MVYSREGDDYVYPMFYMEAVCPPFLYNIPSFDVISVRLRQVKTVGRDKGGKKTGYDVFMRSDDSIIPQLPALLMVKDTTIVTVRAVEVMQPLSVLILEVVSFLVISCLFSVQVEEFKLSVNVEGLSLFLFGVLVVWDWEWNPTDDTSDDSSEGEDETETIAEGHFNPHMESEPSDGEDTADFEIGGSLSTLPAQTHVVTFKCIGTVHDQSR